MVCLRYTTRRLYAEWIRNRNILLQIAAYVADPRNPTCMQATHDELSSLTSKSPFVPTTHGILFQVPTIDLVPPSLLLSLPALGILIVPLLKNATRARRLLSECNSQNSLNAHIQQHRNTHTHTHVAQGPLILFNWAGIDVADHLCRARRSVQKNLMYQERPTP